MFSPVEWLIGLVELMATVMLLIVAKSAIKIIDFQLLKPYLLCCGNYGNSKYRKFLYAIEFTLERHQ